MGKRRLHWTLDDSAAVPAYRSDRPPSVREVSAEDIDIVFQPIVDLQRGRLFAYEALARCRIPGLENPEVLFGQAIHEQAAGRLGRAVREVTFEAIGEHAVFVNVHPAELAARWLVRPDDPIGFHKADVYLEVTESAAFDYPELCRGVLREVCDRTGAKLVIDDFGKGYSNLQRILELDPAVVKLDRTLIQELDQSRKKQLLVSHLVALTVDVGAQVVAEGIETVEELRALRDTGAHFAQGYLIARPGAPPPKPVWPL